jgi:hypothetical protein
MVKSRSACRRKSPFPPLTYPSPCTPLNHSDCKDTKGCIWGETSQKCRRQRRDAYDYDGPSGFHPDYTYDFSKSSSYRSRSPVYRSRSPSSIVNKDKIIDNFSDKVEKALLNTANLSDVQKIQKLLPLMNEANSLFIRNIMNEEQFKYVMSRIAMQ